MKYLTLLLVFAIGIQSFANAYDIPPPGSNPKGPTKTETDTNKVSEPNPGEAIKKLATLQRFAIQTDEKAKVARLVIPNSVIRALQAEGAKSGSIAPGDFFDGQPIVSRMGTVMGGMLIALAVLVGGLWLIRERKVPTPNRAAIVLILALSSIGCASLVYANAGPPPEARSLTNKVLKYAFAAGEVQVETANDNDQIVLIVPISK